MMLLRVLVLNVLIFTAASVTVYAQTSNAADASKRSSYERDDNVAPSERMLETQYRWRVRAEEKEFNEMLERSADALQTSESLKQSFLQNNRFLAGDAAKLNALEKQVKKIRKSLGGDDRETTVGTKPASLIEALDKLIEISGTVNEELKETTRHEVSAASIENVNEMLELIVYIRTLSH